MASAPEKNVIRLKIDNVRLHDLFVLISQRLGYDAEDDDTLDDIDNLVNLWTEQGFVDIYEKNADRQYGRVKDSNSVGGSSPWYIDLFHARLSPKGENDPLVVLSFENVAEKGNSAVYDVVLRFMIDHDRMFGTIAEKMNQARMRAIRKDVDALVQEQKAYTPPPAVGEE